MSETTPAESAAPPPGIPPFSTLLKSRDVEDPVNLWFNRPLAYAFVWLIYRTPLTPNQVTLLAILVGAATCPLFVIGTQTTLLVGGLLLWTSAILDGADGILARAKRMFSDVGRALDGLCDTVVVGFSASGAFFHLWTSNPDPMWILWMTIAGVTAFLQAWLYDYYKESYLQMTNPDWSGEPERLDKIAAWWEETKASEARWYEKWAVKSYRDMVTNQAKWIDFFTPAAARSRRTYKVSAESVAIYRRRHRVLIKLWSLISLAPHAYLMSIAAMFDAFPQYVWFRVIPANVMLVVLLVWQRVASQKTLEDLERAGLAPEPWTPEVSTASA